MMGPRQSRTAKLFYTGVNIEERLDPAHPLRQVKATVDFTFARPQVAACYGVRGNPSLDPILILKLLFLLFYENVASERELLRQLPCRLDWLWFLDLDLDSAIPDHSVLSKARQRWGVAVFTGFFQRVLGQCVAAGLVDGTRVHIDGSLIAANADKDQLTLALELTGQDLYGQLEAAGEEGEREAGKPPVPPACREVAAVPAPVVAPEPGAATRNAAPVEPSPPAAPAAPAPGTLYSPTDPAARLTRKYGQTVLGYKDHRVVDDRCGIITATLTTPAAVAESAMLEAALDAHEANTGREVLAPTADKGYGTTDNYVMLQQRGCTPCIPHPAVREDKTKFARSLFVYRPKEDGYVCPAGQRLTRRRLLPDGRYHYQASRGVCAACLLRSQCTAGKQRVFSRQVHQEAIDWADHCLSPGQRRSRMRRRKIRAEGSFADAANHHGYKRARWRGTDQVALQNLLIATVQNLRKLICLGPAGRRRGAASLVRPALGAKILTLPPNGALGRPLQTFWLHKYELTLSSPRACAAPRPRQSLMSKRFVNDN